MKTQFSNSERRGIVIVAVAALLSLVAGIFASRCSKPSHEPSPLEIETIVGLEDADSAAKEFRKQKRSHKSDSLKKSKKTKRPKAPKTQPRQRRPHDEPVSQ